VCYIWCLTISSLGCCCERSVAQPSLWQHCLVDSSLLQVLWNWRWITSTHWTRPLTSRISSQWGGHRDKAIAIYTEVCHSTTTSHSNISNLDKARPLTSHISIQMKRWFKINSQNSRPLTSHISSQWIDDSQPDLKPWSKQRSPRQRYTKLYRGVPLSYDLSQ